MTLAITGGGIEVPLDQGTVAAPDALGAAGTCWIYLVDPVHGTAIGVEILASWAADPPALRPDRPHG